jgi:hypothetical protein
MKSIETERPGMTRIKIYAIIFFIGWMGISMVSAQSTVGVIKNTEGALEGYTLFTVQNETFLINNCGEMVHQWTSKYNSGKSVYLLENGNLLRAAEVPNPGNITIPPNGHDRGNERRLPQ